MPPKKKETKAEEPQYVDEEGAFVLESVSGRYAGGIRRYTVAAEPSGAKKGAPVAEGGPPPVVVYRHGYGTYNCPTFSYAGHWNLDVMDGKGELHYWSSGAWYDGELVQGRYEGQGTYRWGDGSEYCGEWRGGRMHGEGTFTEPENGRVWRGQYYNGTGPGLERLYRAAVRPELH